MTVGPGPGLPGAEAALFAALRARFHAWTGLMLRRSAERDAALALTQLAAHLGSSVEGCLEALDAGQLPQVRAQLIDRLTIRTTWFMREAASLRALTRALAGREGARDRELTVWTAGCSTGQEPYSILMLLAAEGLSARVIATDVSRQALAAARAGRYPAQAGATLPPELRSRFLVRDGGSLVVAPELRARAEFIEHDLRTLPPRRARVDAVVCRNVLIYFERGEAVGVLRQLAGAVSEGGVVVLAAVEQPLAWMTDAIHIDASEPSLLRRGAPGSAPRVGLRTLPVTVPPSPPSPRASQPTFRTLPAHAPVTASLDAAPLELPATASYMTQKLAAAHERLARRDLDGARALADQALLVDRLSTTAHLLRGLALKQLGDVREAVNAFRRARFLCADEAWMASYQLAICLDLLGQRPDADDAWRQALALLEAPCPSGLEAFDADGAGETLRRTVAHACRTRLELACG